MIILICGILIVGGALRPEGDKYKMPMIIAGLLLLVATAGR